MNEGRLTLKSIAGYCIEEALWKLAIDIASELQEKKCYAAGIDPLIMMNSIWFPKTM